MGFVDPFKKIKLLEIIGKHIPDGNNKSNSSSNQELGSNQRDGVNSGGGVVPNKTVEVPSTTATTKSLRENMKKEGMEFDAGEEAHHIVAKGDDRAAEAREKIKPATQPPSHPSNL